jgi:hypothetical protein
MRKILAWFAPIVWFGDEIVRRIVYWAAFIVLVSAPMSWVASYIAPIAQYGWGAVVFAGVGAACAITLVICGLLVAWRFFNPLSLPQSATSLDLIVTNIFIVTNASDTTAAALLFGTAAKNLERVKIFLDYSGYVAGWGVTGWSQRRRIAIAAFDPFEKDIRYEATIVSRTIDADGKITVLKWGNDLGNRDIIGMEKYQARLEFVSPEGGQYFYFMLVSTSIPNGRNVTILNQNDFSFQREWEEA